MKKKSIQILALIIALVTLLSVSAFADSYLPSLSDYKYVKTYCRKSSGRIYAYTDSSLRNEKGSNWWIDCKEDECYIIEISGRAVKISYPIGNGRRPKAWFEASEFSSFDLSPSYPMKKANRRIDAYRRSDGRDYYGYVGSGDNIYILGTSGNYTQVVYPLSESNWKMAWIKTSEANSYLSGGTSNNTSIACPVRNYDETNHAGLNGTSWGYYSSNYRSNNRHWHTGIDLKVSGDSYSSRSHNIPEDYVYALTNGTVKAVGYNSANGNYVVIEHIIDGNTVYSFYGHLYEYCVSKGNSVDCNTVIGSIGWSGDSPGNGKHLHFAIANKLDINGSYVGYTNVNILDSRTNVASYANVSFYNPWYVIENNRLP